MCGIGGVLFKNGTGKVGADLERLIYGIRHRGEDSSGVAIFSAKEKAGENDVLLINVRVENGKTEDVFSVVEDLLKKAGGEVLEAWTKGTIMSIRALYGGSKLDLCYELDRRKVQTISIGNQLRIYKDLGTSDQLDQIYNYRSFEGTHGIGHARLATESMVSPDRAHPFWAYGFSDVAIVHNGQLTNYWKLRRKFEMWGYQFRTDNDSELIAIYIAHHLKKGMKLQDILEQSLSDLDGTYTFLVSTPTEIGFAKDKLAAKPLVYVDLEDRVVLASEEISLQALLPDLENVTVVEPPPYIAGTWSVTGEHSITKLTYQAVGLE
ncbi:MAG: amidophosphoribosyltransferase [Bacillota bacterium]